LRRLCAQLICCLAVASSCTVAAAGTPGYIATPDTCCVVDRVVEDTVHLRKVGVCAGKPGRAYIETKLKKVKVVVEGALWKETDVEGLTVPDLANSLSNADRLAKQLTVHGNRHEKEMTDLAGTLDSYYHSDEFQLRVLNETERITSEVFGDKIAGYYADKGKEVSKGKLAASERVYVFISSAMPLATIRNYAASVARLGDPNVSLVMRGFVDGVSKIQPTIGFIASVLQRDQACRLQTVTARCCRQGCRRSPVIPPVPDRPGSRSGLCPRAQGRGCRFERGRSQEHHHLGSLCGIRRRQTGISAQPDPEGERFGFTGRTPGHSG